MTTEAPPLIDLTAVLFAQRSKPRGDELLTHFSDVWTCLRAVYMRRNGYEPRPYTADELAKFQVGHDFEHGVARTLREAGHKVVEGLDVAAFGLDSGHPDLIVDDELALETKTTDARKPKDTVSKHHAVQVSMAALALKLPRAAVLVKHAGSHIETAYPVEPEGYRALIEERAAQVVAQTAPGQPMPPAVPSDIPPYDECQYCRFSACERNPHYNAEDVL